MTKDDLKKFAANDRTDSSSIKNPWSIDSHSMATNGYILIRIPRLEEIPESAKAPDCTNLWPKDQPQEWFEIPDLPTDEYKPCEECRGKGKVRHGKGEPLKLCEDCQGTGKEKILNQKISIGCAIFGGWLLRLLKILPKVQIGPMQEYQPAWIRFDGGDGLIMPMGK